MSNKLNPERIAPLGVLFCSGRHHLLFRTAHNQRSAAARQIAANIAKLPELVR